MPDNVAAETKAVKIPAQLPEDMRKLVDNYHAYTVIKLSERKVVAVANCWISAQSEACKYAASAYCYDGQLYTTYEGEIDRG